MDLEKDNSSPILDQKDWFNTLSEEELKEIEIGIEQAKNNQFTDHEEVMKIFLKYKAKNLGKF
ncbi:hypothetical protein [Flavobacterium hercynium]|uniref:Uncharacterized protein n=1 Tax=Flavobacterium hercynium TaxID=387094 RepID=A0A226HFP6_9FLAO|nr:hypothetical protein [Flavobacterium hercynium]OXA92934.1 hypothetical protein B0A66_09215 [Flavobacterium hercynium]SMP03402.1 hypothetical protein SAMN06265346_101278 [Flavobacterium hercynium]